MRSILRKKVNSPSDLFRAMTENYISFAYCKKLEVETEETFTLNELIQIRDRVENTQEQAREIFFYLRLYDSMITAYNFHSVAMGKVELAYWKAKATAQELREAKTAKEKAEKVNQLKESYESLENGWIFCNAFNEFFKIAGKEYKLKNIERLFMDVSPAERWHKEIDALHKKLKKEFPKLLAGVNFFSLKEAVVKKADLDTLKADLKEEHKFFYTDNRIENHLNTATGGRLF